MPNRLFTPAEANRLIPRVERLVEKARALVSEIKDVRDQLNDLRIVWGDRIETEACPDHAEYERYVAQYQEAEGNLRGILEEVVGLGCEVKDIESGLVDFTAQRGSEVVYLCWKYGEKAIVAWHPLNAGYAGRRPLKEF